MKRKFLLFITSVLATLSCLAGSSVTTHTVTFDFSTVDGLTTMGITVPQNGGRTYLANNATFTSGDVTLTNTNSTSSTYQNSIYYYSNAQCYELYLNSGASLSFSAPANCDITAINVSGNNLNYLNGVNSQGNWDGSSTTLIATTKTVYIFSITVTYTKSTPQLTQVTGISNFKNVTPGTAVTLYLPDDLNARVLAVKNNADGTTDAFVRDDTGAMLMKGISPSRNMAHDQHLAGWINGQYTENNGLPCFVPADGLTNTSLLVIADPVTEEATQPQAITPDLYDDYLADWITMNEIVVGNTDFSFVNNFNLAGYTAPYNGAIVDVSGIAAGGYVLYPFNIGQEPLFTYVIDVTQPFATPTTTITGVPVRLIRTFTAGQWTPFTLPFDTDDFDGDIMAYVALQNGAPITGDTSGTTYEAGSMVFTRVGEMEAGMPYLVRSTESFYEKTFTGVTLAPVTPTTVTHTLSGISKINSDNAYSFVPVLSPVTLDPSNKAYKVMLGNGSIAWVNDTNNQLPGTSAYFVTPADQGLHIVLQGVDGGIITGIEGVTSPAASRLTGIYNMMGVKMQLEWDQLPPGIYIVNGRKTIKR